EDLQHRHGCAAGPLGRPDRQVGRGGSTTPCPAAPDVSPARGMTRLPPAARGITPPGSPARIQSISIRYRSAGTAPTSDSFSFRITVGSPDTPNHAAPSAQSLSTLSYASPA